MISGFFGKIARMDPDLATRSTRKIFSSDLLIFFWQVWTDAVWIECLSVFPTDLGSVRIDLERLCLRLRLAAALSCRLPHLPRIVR